MAEVEVTDSNEMIDCTFDAHGDDATIVDVSLENEIYFLEPTPELRFVVRYENICKEVQVLQQRWIRRDSKEAETFWQDVPTVDD